MDDNLPKPTDNPKPATGGKAPAKQSYESNPDVQRWIRTEAEAHDSAELPFNPALLASRRDGFWILSSLTVFYQQGLITDVLSQASSGKEATVYCCSADPSTGVELLAAKVYRPRMFRSLSNDAIYRESRVARGADGRARNARRARRETGGDNESRRALQVSQWIEHEYRTQQLLFAAGAAVPRPLAQIGNAILMDYIGDAEQPAPRLKDAGLDRGAARALFEGLISQIRLWLAHHCIHGDLSEYNILVWDDRLITIDFAQAVDPRHNPDIYTLLERDVQRVCGFFARHGVRADAGALAADIWTEYLVGAM